MDCGLASSQQEDQDWWGTQEKEEAKPQGTTSYRWHLTRGNQTQEEGGRQYYTTLLSTFLETRKAQAEQAAREVKDRKTKATDKNKGLRG